MDGRVPGVDWLWFAVYGAFQRAADDIARAQADGERKGQDDASEENPEGQLDDRSADLKMVKNHRRCENEDKPLHTERQEAGVLQLCVDRSDENGAGEEAGDEVSDEQQQERADGVGKVRQEREVEGRT